MVIQLLTKLLSLMVRKKIRGENRIISSFFF
jgi:hypothetical protein